MFLSLRNDKWKPKRERPIFGFRISGTEVELRIHFVYLVITVTDGKDFNESSSVSRSRGDPREGEYEHEMIFFGDAWDLLRVKVQNSI